MNSCFAARVEAALAEIRRLDTAATAEFTGGDEGLFRVVHNGSHLYGLLVLRRNCRDILRRHDIGSLYALQVMTAGKGA